MRPLTTLSLLLFACARPPSAPPPALAPPPAPPIWIQPRPIVLRHATVLPVSGPAIQDGAIAFANGTITAIGPNGAIATPAGAEEIDVRGRFITPGIIDVHSHLGVYPSPTLTGNSDGNEMSSPVTAEVSAQHAFWPQDPGLRRAAGGGITSLLVLPGSANLIGGRGFPVKLHFGRTAAEMRFPGAKDVLKIACGENPKRFYGRERKSAPVTRMGNVAGYRAAFQSAKEYQQKWIDHERKTKTKAKKGEPQVPPARDLKLETLAGVLRGEILVQNHCYRADEMETMLSIARELGFRIRAFHHALEAYKVRDLLAREEVAIATWADWWGFKLEAWDGIPENAGLMAEAGGRAVIHSDSAHGIQRLNQEAGKALAAARAAGMTLAENDALRWITLNAAWVMGVEQRTGSLEVGKMADLVVWRGAPLSVYARVERVYADGLLTYSIEGGAAQPSDFELSAQAAPASAPLLPPAPPLPVGKADAPPLQLPEKDPSCTIIRDALALLPGAAPAETTVTIRDGKIAAIAPASGGPPAQTGCRVIEARGLVLAPGFIEPVSGLGLLEVALEDSTVDLGARGRAAEQPIHAALRAADSFNSGSELLPIARLGGLTGAVITPEGGLIAGQGAFVSSDGEIIRPVVAVSASLGSGAASAVSSTRGAALELLREVLEDARVYAKRRADFEQNRIRPMAASRLDLEALQPVVEGKLPLVVAADRAAEIRAAIALSREQKIRVVIAGGAQAWQLADELARAAVPVILQPTDNLPSTFDRRGARIDAAALLAHKGVKVLFSTLGEPHRSRTLAQEAGNAVAYGLPYADSIASISSHVAEVFGLPGGRIAVGARADLALWNGDPLETQSRVLGIFIAGRQVSLRTRQSALLEKYRHLR